MAIIESETSTKTRLQLIFTEVLDSLLGIALMELATAYAVAIRLRDAGAADDSVAQALGIPTESVAGVLRVAEAKLAALLDAADPEQAAPR